MNTYIKQAQSGRSMIEMLGVLAIIGVLSAGGIAGYSMAMSSYKANNLMDKIQMMSTQARILYNGTYTNDADIDSQLVNLKYIADATNPFSGTDIAATGKGATFEIVAADVPTDACVKYLTSDWGDASIFSTIKAGEGTARGPGATAGEGETAAATAKATVAQAVSDCGTTTSSVTWVFK